MLIGTEGVRTATGQRLLPGTDDSDPAVGAGAPVQHTPNGSDSYQWGDTQRFRTLWIQTRASLTSLFAGALQDDAPVGPYLSELTEEFGAWPGESKAVLQPYPRFMLSSTVCVP